ncbi:MAG: phosphatidylserine decarboxylase, partial [Vibrionaceae bacterium]
MSDNLKIGLQYCMPKRLLTRLIGKLAGAKAGFVTQGLIKGFIYQYKIDMNEAKHSDPSHFTTFNEFFTRELKDGARPIVADSKTFCFPVDGSVSQFGQIQAGNLMQAKGQTFEAVELLGGDAALAAEFN